MILAGAVGVGAVAPAAARGQVTLSLDIGGATVAYDQLLRSLVASATPAVLLERGRATFLARGSYSRFESGNESLEGTVAGSVLSAAVWKLRGEVGASASTTRYKTFTAATSVSAVGRLHLADANRGLWLGSAVGGVSQKSLFPDDVLQLELGGWVHVHDVTFTAELTPSRVGDTTSFTDATAGMRWLGPDGDLSITAGYRGGKLGGGVNRWMEFNGTVWVGRRLALVGGIGVFPAELVRGLPGGRYASAALRLASRRPTGSEPEVVEQLIVPYEVRELRALRRRRARAEEFVVAQADDGTRNIHIRVPQARTVELMADFTDWTPVRLARERGGMWGLNVFVPPGVHRVNIRVDGGEWGPPPGLTTVPSGFGGLVGLLVVQ